MMHSGDIFFDNNVLRNISQSINLSQIIVSNCFTSAEINQNFKKMGETI